MAGRSGCMKNLRAPLSTAHTESLRGCPTIFGWARSSFARNLLGLGARAIRGLVCGALFYGFRPVFAAAEGIAAILAQPRGSCVGGSGSTWSGRGAAVRRDGWAWVGVSTGKKPQCISSSPYSSRCERAQSLCSHSFSSAAGSELRGIPPGADSTRCRRLQASP